MDTDPKETNARNWNPEAEDPFPSLSDNHDHEPFLEFDDSEVLNPTGNLGALMEPLADYIESPVSDGTIEENFEEALASAPQVYRPVGVEGDSLNNDIDNMDAGSFDDLHGKGLIEVVGDDSVGRRIIVVSACRLPSSQEVPQDKLLRYFMFTLEQFVNLDYCVVYFHHGLTSKNKPTVSWLWKAYKAFDRKYKKNLKALYLVHPTNFIRIVWQMLRPAISAKFGKKMMYVNYLDELKVHLDLSKICIPQSVLDHDKELCSKNKKIPGPSGMSTGAGQGKPEDGSTSRTAVQTYKPPTQQFGVSLQFIKEHNSRTIDSIPPIVRQCVEFLSKPDALETEGIFRRSANVALIKEYQSICDSGGEIDFQNNPHIPAVLLKTFLRDLEEPILTFDLYDEIIQFQTWSKDDRPRRVKILILENLHIDNYKLLKYIMQFLWKVMDRSDLNKMTSSNLAVVFGPNLIWPSSGQMSLQAIAPINSFTDFLLQNQESIFII